MKDRAKEHLGRNKFTVCSYPECDKIAIYSHAISKKISISSIAEDNHLTFFNPKRRGSVKVPKFDSIGINDCSGFNGFCKDHDDLFQEIDKNIISTSEHVKLQLYRSLSFELHKDKVGMFQNIKLDDEHATQALIDLNIISSESESTCDLRNLVKRKFDFLMRESLDDKLWLIEKLSLYMLHLLKIKDYFEFQTDTFYAFSTDNLKHQVFYYMTSYNIPVAINTKITLSDAEPLNYYFIVIPFEGKSLIMGIVPDDSQKLIQDKINSVFNEELSVIKFIESVISSCDGWYIKPSIIDNMPDEKKKVFLDDCMFINERRFYQDYDLSIFDGLKMEICGLEHDSEELTVFPNRDEYESRYNVMMEAITRSII
ncbi:hypothetical protein MD588_24780 [Photobacterium sp. SDRW27]|uniref:hypothetical protein n=1 Tax=Photobacterium obscurum TaxID=2829490 RepID=UPI0022436DF7|nr:hypothetical protein [Photobacterium obscurum]MCW8332013.1 hypothetical protein [Photobacterium obscurum]